MSCHPRVTEWTAMIQTHLPHLTKPPGTVLALWSLGMVLARCCALSAVSAFLGPWLSRKENTVRQPWREFCYEATAKHGTTRTALSVETCLASLLAWVVCLWQRTHMTQPDRAAGLWLAVAVATLWLLSVGGEAEETVPASTVPDITALVPRQPRTRRATRLRLVHVFRRGWNLILVALLDQAPLPVGRFIPEPWPVVTARAEQGMLLSGLEMPLAA